MSDYVVWGYVVVLFEGVLYGFVDDVLVELGIKCKIVSVVLGFLIVFFVVLELDFIVMIFVFYLFN